MSKSSQDKLQDFGSERGVLAGIIEHGPDLLFEIEEILDTDDFHKPTNQKIFAILKHLVHETGVKSFDLPNILACAKSRGYNEFRDNRKNEEFLESLSDGGPSAENVLSLAVVVYKLSIGRRAWHLLDSTIKKVRDINGEEDLADIVSTIEDPVFKFTGSLITQNQILMPLVLDFVETMEARANKPQDIIGLPTGFSNWDHYIGGGLRRGTVNVVGARPKKGKSFFCLNVAKNMAEIDIPVLYLDTELLRELQMDRLIALVSGIELTRIESGEFAADPNEREAVLSCKEKLENLKITHQHIAGQPIKSVLSIARRWLAKEVGLTDAGIAKPCLIIYDYLKIMDVNDMKESLQEYQLLGFLMTAFHNFATRWELPILATVQLNRDGVGKEGGQFISGSDRILWLCSNFTILKNKSSEELNEDPPQNGTKKLVITETRFGPGMEPEEYINVLDKLECGRLSEGKTFSQAMSDNVFTGNPQE